MSTTAATHGLARELAGLVGAEFVTDDPVRTAEFAIDEAVPRAVISPASPEQIAVVMEYAGANDLAVVRQAGSRISTRAQRPRRLTSCCAPSG